MSPEITDDVIAFSRIIKHTITRGQLVTLLFRDGMANTPLIHAVRRRYSSCAKINALVRQSLYEYGEGAYEIDSEAHPSFRFFEADLRRKIGLEIVDHHYPYFQEHGDPDCEEDRIEEDRINALCEDSFDRWHLDALVDDVRHYPRDLESEFALAEYDEVRYLLRTGEVVYIAVNSSAVNYTRIGAAKVK